MKVKITPDVRNDRHSVVVGRNYDGIQLSDLNAAADLVAQSASCAASEVRFNGAYGIITAEFRVSLNKEEYLKRSGF